MMRRLIIALTLAAGIPASYVFVSAQTRAASTPFKLGTFERDGRVFVGLSIRDTHVADLAAANAAFEQRNASAPKVRMANGWVSALFVTMMTRYCLGYTCPCNERDTRACYCNLVRRFRNSDTASTCVGRKRMTPTGT